MSFPTQYLGFSLCFVLHCSAQSSTGSNVTRTTQQTPNTAVRSRSTETPAPTPQPQPQPQPQTPPTVVDNAITNALSAHAQVRAEVSVGPLEWSANLATVAQDWASHLCQEATARRRTVLQHRPNNQYGENLFWLGGTASPPTFQDAVQNWHQERRFYNPSRNRCEGGVCGHYTQLVWSNTRSVGCGIASCNEQHFIVCNYDPPGNFVGQRPYPTR